jgi:lipopolysaccharide heptosyltransferase I
VNAAAGKDSARPRLLIVRLGAMGDVIHGMNAVAGLRESLPDAHIGWLIEERWLELLCARGAPRSGPRIPSRPLVDAVHVVDTKKWRKTVLASNTRRDFTSVLREVREQKYDAAIDLQGAIKSAVLARLAKAAIIFGMRQPRETPARWFYSRKVPGRGSHVIDHYHSVVQEAAREFGAGVPASIASAPPFPTDSAAEACASRMVGGSKNHIVLINPGAGWGAKQWPAERYGEIAKLLAKEGCTVFVNYGPDEESLARKVEAASGGAAQFISSSISELVALTRRTSLFIGGDTGPMHLAAALRVPVVAIFGPTDPARNGPYGTRSIVLRRPESQTSLSHTAATDPRLLNVTVIEVLKSAEDLLEETHG